MGSFSFLCKECGEQIVCDDDVQDDVLLYLLKDGKIIESMSGLYDSYGRVEVGDFTLEWDMDWDNVCGLMERDDHRNGIAAIHKRCFYGNLPTSRSEDDPNQGWIQQED